jgi:alcohol dehydrogenase
MNIPPGFQLQFSRTRLICRPGAVASLPDELQQIGGKRWMLVTGTRSADGAAAQAVRKAMGPLIVANWTGIPQHSGVDVITAMTEHARENGVDGFVAVGGGSASDSAKAAAILLAEGGSLADHANVFYPPDRYVQQVLTKPKLPIVAIPTTLSAAEVTPGLGIRNDDGHKLVFWDPGVVPRLIVLDAGACTDVPADIFATTGMNALAHSIEGMYSRVRNPASEALALQSIRHLSKALPQVVDSPADVAARERALIGAYLSGLVISNARVGIHHGLCHGLGSMGGLSHGMANAVFLPHAMRFNLDAARDPLAMAASAFDPKAHDLPAEQAALSAVESVARLQQRLGLPARLRDTGLDHAMLPRLARHAMSDRGLYFNPRLASEAEVLQLLESAW